MLTTTIDPNRWFRVKELGCRTDKDGFRHVGLLPYSQDFIRDVFETHPAVKIEASVGRSGRLYRYVFLIPGWAVSDWLQGKWRRPQPRR